MGLHIHSLYIFNWTNTHSPTSWINQISDTKHFSLAQSFSTVANLIAPKPNSTECTAQWESLRNCKRTPNSSTTRHWIELLCWIRVSTVHKVHALWLLIFFCRTLFPTFAFISSLSLFELDYVIQNSEYTSIALIHWYYTRIQPDTALLSFKINSLRF